MKQAFELKVPKALSAVEEVRDVLMKALAGYPAENKDEVAEAVEQGAEIGDIRIALAADEENNLVGISIIALPTTALAPYPQVIAFFCGDGAAARNKLVDKTVEIVREAGYGTFWALIAGDDGRRLRAFKRAGETGRVGGFVEFKLA